MNNVHYEKIVYDEYTLCKGLLEDNMHSITNISTPTNIIYGNNSPREYTQLENRSEILRNSKSFDNGDDDLRSLLMKWNLGSVYETCIGNIKTKIKIFVLKLIVFFLEQKIDLEALQLMNDIHFPILLKNFPLGIQIKFEHYVKNYQKSLNSVPHIGNKTSKIINNTDQIVEKYIPPINQVFQLNSILTNYPQGAFVQDYFKEHNTLSESCRNILVEIIIKDIIKKNCHMTVKLANSIGDAIIGTFPTEIKVIKFNK